MITRFLVVLVTFTATYSSAHAADYRAQCIQKLATVFNGEVSSVICSGATSDAPLACALALKGHAEGRVVGMTCGGATSDAPAKCFMNMKGPIFGRILADLCNGSTDEKASETCFRNLTGGRYKVPGPYAAIACSGASDTSAVECVESNAKTFGDGKFLAQFCSANPALRLKDLMEKLWNKQ